MKPAQTNRDRSRCPSEVNQVVSPPFVANAHLTYARIAQPPPPRLHSSTAFCYPRRMPAPRQEQRRWAERVAPGKIRNLYQGEAQGLLDTDLLLQVGWALWARARDVIEVSTAVLTGTLPCPECGAEAHRTRARPRTMSLGRPVRCGHCGYEGDWYAVREALRREPRCLNCATPLEWSYAEWVLTCPSCDTTVPHRRYRDRLQARKRLPCPSCQAMLTRPPLERADSGPGPQATTSDRTPDVASCPTCGWSERWTAVRRSWQGQRLLTGAGVPACKRFADEWPACRDVAAQMISVDSFLHELHTGPLAPLFIAASPESVLELLDEIGGIRRRDSGCRLQR